MKTSNNTIQWPKQDVKFKTVGTDTDEKIFLSVGRALTKWETVESQLGMLFKLLLESDSIAGERVYGDFTSPSIRKKALIQAGEIYYDRHREEFPYDSFKTLLNDYEKGAGFRNKIAHGMVTKIGVEDSDVGYFLVPAIYSNKNDAKTYGFWEKLAKDAEKNSFSVFGFGYRYTHADIDDISQLFEELRVSANQVWNSQFMLGIKKSFEQINAKF